MSRLSNLKKQIILEANIKLSEQASPANKTKTPTVNNSPENLYRKSFLRIWKPIRNSIVYGGRNAATNKINGVMQWVYPEGTTEPPVQLHDDNGNVVNQTILGSYDKLFNDKLIQASNDNTWLREMGNTASGLNSNTNDNILVQQYIMNNISDKSLVKDNGSGGPFDDGQFNSVTLKALINLTIQNGYRDSSFMLSQKPPLL